MKFEFDYSKEHDILTIYNYELSTPEESVEISEYLVIDIDKNNKIIGIEIFDASEFFGALNNINKEFLENLENVELEQKEFRNNWLLAVKLTSKYGTISQPLPPLRKSEYVSPLTEFLSQK